MKCFEDFAVGDVLLLGETAVSHDDIVGYARTYDPSPLHLDGVAATQALRVRDEIADPDEPPAEALLPLDGIVASNWHVGAMFMRTFFDSLLANSAGRGSPGIDSLKWPIPVRAGDTIRFTLEIMEVKESRSRPDLGLVLFDMLGVNQLGETVMIGRCWTMFGRREAGPAVDPAPKSAARPGMMVASNTSEPAPAAKSTTGSLWFDDVAVGDVTEIGSRRFEAEDIVGFAQNYDPQPFHLSEEAGKASIFGGLAASGWHTAVVWQGLATAHDTAMRSATSARGEALPPPVLMPSVTDLRWLKPVLAGDTISYRMTVLDKSPSPTNPGWGVVRSRAEGINPRGDLAFALIARRFMQLRP
jgi:acyl dehydratase